MTMCFTMFFTTEFALTVPPVPLRVLQVAAWAKEHPLVGYLEVWHTADIKKDPILVGRRECYGGENFLLARWGDALESFDVLQVKAQEVIEANLRAAIKTCIGKLNHALESVPENARKATLTGLIETPQVWGI